MRRFWVCWIGLVAMGMFTACGSVGGGDADITVPGGLPVLDAATADLVAGEGAGVMSTISDISEFSENLFSTWFDSEFAARAAPRLIVGTCTAGTLDAAFTDTDESGDMTVGDTVTFTFTGCVIPNGEGGSETFSGTIDMSVTNIVGGPMAPFTLGLAYTFGPTFSVDDGENVTQVSGGFAYSLASTDDVNFVVTFDGSSLTFTEVGPDGTYTGTVTDFTTTLTSNENTGAYSIDARGTVNTSDLPMAITYGHTVPFSGTEPNNPDTGALVISPALIGGTVTVTAVDTVWVDVSLDADEDGTPEQTTRVRWDDL